MGMPQARGHHMNLRRGLFRLWIVIAVLWIGVAVWFLGEVAFSPWPGHLVNGPTRTQSLLIIFVPPIALFGLGFVCIWVARGFFRNDVPK
jgi:hypothetical protein